MEYFCEECREEIDEHGRCAWCSQYDDSDEEEPDTTCKYCSGTGEGQYDGTRCHECNGSGEVDYCDCCGSL